MAKIKLNRRYAIIVAFLLTIIATLSFVLLFFTFFYGKVYPGVYVVSTHIGGLSREDAEKKLEQNLPLQNEVVVSVNHSGAALEFAIPLSSIGASANYKETVVSAYNVGRGGKKREDIRTILNQVFNQNSIDLIIDYDEQKLTEQISLIRAQSPPGPKPPSLAINQGAVEFVQGEAGVTINTESLKKTIISAIKSANRYVIFAPKVEDPTLSEGDAAAFVMRGTVLASKSLTLTSDSNKFTYEGAQILNFLRPAGGYYFDNIIPSLAEVANAVKSPPTNPVFTYGDGRVHEFSPAKDGLEVELPALEERLSDALSELEATELDSVSVEIPVKRTPPDFATADVNDLGIKELIGVGTSTFRGSIPSRVYNVALAAARLNGVLVKPGETFSFVNTLGDISALTGYKQAYVIQGSQTILGDGGGVCQVSTTFFRAALAAGLPIIERHPHSYRVGYYEQDSPPGIDATIYHPTVDIKIKNDTPGHILIQTFADTKNMTLRFEFYGTSDGRVATIGKPAVSSVTPPPEDLYVDDPTLPAGEVKQVDYKAWGAKVSFDYKVERNGEVTFEDTYFSNYRPWQAKFLRGTGPAQ